MAKEKIYKRRPGPATLKEREEALFADFPGRDNSLEYKVKNMKEAKDLITSCLDGIIRVFGDYDADGMTSTRGLATILEPLFPADVDYYIPRRESDGYGISIPVLERVLPELSKKHKNNDALLITVDNGIAASEAVQYAKELGWKVLIIDHHLPATDDDGNIIVPPADIIVDPHYTGDSDFVSYCAAGLILKLAQEFYGDDEEDVLMKKIHSLAALGTVGDCVPLIEEVDGHNAYDNYLIVKRGLETLIQNDGTTVGLFCLLRALGKEYSVNESDIAFTIAPAMNAMSRMEDDGAQLVFDLIGRTSDYGACDALAAKCVDANKDRKAFTEAALPVLKSRIEENGHENDYPIVVTAQENEVHPGIIGLVAGNLSGYYNTMVVALVNSADGENLGGSGRAPEGCDLKAALDAAKEYLGKYGGHKAAAGVSLPAGNLEAFTKVIQAYCGEKPEELFWRYYDYEVDLSGIADEIAVAKKYAPFGMGHPAPVYKVAFKCEPYRGNYYTLMGANKNMLKLTSKHANAVNFTGSALEQFNALGKPMQVTVYGTLNENVYNGQVTNQILISDLYPAE